MRGQRAGVCGQTQGQTAVHGWLHEQADNGSKHVGNGPEYEKPKNLKYWAFSTKKNTFQSLRPHDKNLDLARTFAVRRLRGCPLACILARYLLRVLTGARRKRIGFLSKKLSDDQKNPIYPLTFFLQIPSG